MSNTKIADIFEDIADILEFQGENPFKIRAYRKAAVNLRSMSEDVNKYAKDDTLTTLPGIGKDLAEKINEILKTGSLKAYQKLKKSIPKGLLEVMAVSGVGPKTAKLLYDELKVDSIKKLKKYAEQHKLSKLPHLKEKTEQNILEGIKILEKSTERMLLGEAVPIVESVINYLKNKKSVEKISPAGSTRRMRETIRDIDILIASKKPKDVMDTFLNMPQVSRVLAHGETKSSILTKDNIQIDLRVVSHESYGAALCYFTGSKAHNIHLRELAIKNKLKINEYGVFKQRGNKKIGGKTEEEVYSSVGLKLIPPELREDKGEIEVSKNNKLPHLVQHEDIKGDLHMHSEWSDGSYSIEEIARFCKNLGYEYVAICDHSKSLKVAGGLSEKDLAKKNKEIDAINKKMKGLKVLKGTEVDILSDGSLDYCDDVLKDLDVVFAAVHTGFKQSKEVITKRILKAMDNKYADVLAHPTGRLLNTREPYAVDIPAVLKHAKETNTAIEINGNPQRLDLDDVNSRAASKMGIKLVLITDAHILEQLNYMRFAVSVARRAWLTKKDILNTLPAADLLKTLRK